MWNRIKWFGDVHQYGKKRGTATFHVWATTATEAKTLLELKSFNAGHGLGGIFNVRMA